MGKRKSRYIYKQAAWVSRHCILLLSASQKAAESLAEPNTRLSPAASVTVQLPSACPPLQKTTGKERALLFLPPLLTQLGGLEPGEVPPPEDQEPLHTHCGVQAALEQAKLLRPSHMGLWSPARASLSPCWTLTEVAMGKDHPSCSWWIPLSWQPWEGSSMGHR